MTTFPSNQPLAEPVYCRSCAEVLTEPELQQLPAPEAMPDEPLFFACPYCDGLELSYMSDEAERQWERQQEDAMSEPPPTAAEQHQAAWEEKQRLRR